MSDIVKDAEIKFQKAKLALLQGFAYFGHVCWQLKIEVAQLKNTITDVSTRADYTIRTAATDGKSLWYNPVFVNGLTIHQTMGLLAHELLHCLNLHHVRIQPDWDLEVANNAADYVINPLLKQAGLYLWEGALLDDRFNGLSLEQVYSILISEKQKANKQANQSTKGNSGQTSGQTTPQASPQNQPQASNGQANPQASNGQASSPQTNSGQASQASGQTSGQVNPQGTAQANGQANGQATPQASPQGNHGQVEQWGNIMPCSQADKPKEQAKWEQALILADMLETKAGMGSADFKRIIQDNGESRIDWRNVLAEFVESMRSDDFSWEFPDENYIQDGLYIPDVFSRGLPGFHVGNDVSGSVNDVQLAAAGKALTDLMNDAKPDSLTVLHFDTRIQNTQTFYLNEQVKLETKGGGGTDFRCVFNELKDKDVRCLVMITDLDGRFPAEAPPYPVLWIATGRIHKAPFGRVVRMNV